MAIAHSEIRIDQYFWLNSLPIDCGSTLNQHFCTGNRSN